MPPIRVRVSTITESKKKKIKRKAAKKTDPQFKTHLKPQIYNINSFRTFVGHHLSAKYSTFLCSLDRKSETESG